MPKMRLFLLACVLLAGSCGYRFERDQLQPRTLSVPFAEGDTEGDLTAAVIQQISSSGVYTYRKEGGNLLLKIKVVDLRDENIGFRYYRNKEGKLKKDIIPTETRMAVTAEVTLVEAGSCTPILGPTLITAGVDFDHDFYSSDTTFSLGQLNDYDSAYDAVVQPLNKALAQKIVDFVNDGW